MRVCIAAAQFSSQLSGIQRHALMLTKSLLQQSSISQVDLVIAPWQEYLFRSIEESGAGRIRVHVAEMSRGVVGRNVWYYRDFPALVQSLRSDIVHLSYPVPLQRNSMAVPVALTLHDLYPYDIPGNFGFPKMFFNRAILRQCMSNAQAIACVSGTTLSRLEKLGPDSLRRKAVRIFNCVEPSPEWSDVSPLPNWQGEPFLLTVSQHRRNKNIPLLLQTFHSLLTSRQLHPHTRLVVVGIAGPETSSIQKQVAHLGLLYHVLFLDGIADDELQWCYRHCDVLLAPSEIEGFGLPVAEGLLAGCRIVCSDIPAFREIDPQHCIFFSLQGPREVNLRNAILAALNTTQPIPITLPQFSAAQIGAQYVRLYQQLIEEKESACHTSGRARATTLWGTTPGPSTSESVIERATR
jgi:glycosyltransferase involved in cell wall biosynthesis